MVAKATIGKKWRDKLPLTFSLWLDTVWKYDVMDKIAYQKPQRESGSFQSDFIEIWLPFLEHITSIKKVL